jgi:hypothetical protein
MQAQLPGHQPADHLRHLWVNHVLVAVHHHVGEGHHVAGKEVGAPALLAAKLPQVVKSVHACGMGSSRSSS